MLASEALFLVQNNQVAHVSMPRHPLQPPMHSSVNSISRDSAPLKHRQSHHNSDQVGLWRTQSLDEGSSRGMSGCHDDDVSDENTHLGSSSEVVALHTSFDAALLEGDKSDDSIFSIMDKNERMTDSPRNNSWDEHNVTNNALGELSGRKHLRQRAPSTEMLQPDTVRKLPRRGSEGISTPGRLPVAGPASTIKTTIGSMTPTSASRRRQRTPFHQRKSPAYKGPSSISFTRMPPTPASSLKLRPPSTLTPTRSTHFSWPATVVKASTRSNATGVTTTETSVDTDSHGTNSPSTTPFRFTSFPASLPRVHPRSADGGYTSPLPASVKKHMTFEDKNGSELTGQSADHGDARASSSRSSTLPLHMLSSQCRDDDGTHNSSFSSWSADGGGPHMTFAAPSVPPTVLEWKSPPSDDDDSMDMDEADKNSDDKKGLPSQAPIHGQLFKGNDDYSYSEDEEAAHLGGSVGRTRLNFNLVLSPPQMGASAVARTAEVRKSEDRTKESDNAEGDDKVDLSRTYEQRRVNSFPSSVSSDTPLRNVSGCEESVTASSATAFSPSRAGSGSMGALLEGCRPETPEEVQIHFNVDNAQCSPIPGILEDDGVGRTMLAPRFNESKAENESSSDEGRDTKLHISRSEESGGSSSTTCSSKMRKLRPMPDISAFEAGGGPRSTSLSNHEKSVESNVAQSASPKLLCPPTPVRTPAWAHAEGGNLPVYTRTNSLIVTKVLATCPPQVLDGHSSLENSLLEDEDSASSTIEQRRASLSFSTVDQEMEDSGSDKKKSSRILPESSPALSPNAMETEAEPVAAAISSSPVTKGSRKPNVSKLSIGSGQVDATLSFASEFENLGVLGSGAFADVYKVRSRSDKQLYAVKRNRRRFRGKRDREMALTEVRMMQRLQSVCAGTGATSGGKDTADSSKKSLYLLFFFRAWQEDGYFFCQTELCCRDTCHGLIESLGSQWTTASKNYPSLLRNLPPVARTGGNCNDVRLLPGMTLWKICHDVAAGLSHIHRHGVIHADVKPENIFLVAHSRLGALCKIGDFGMACDVGTVEDGQEGDTYFMAPELLATGAKHPSSDIFSLGLTLYKLAADAAWRLPSEGPRWHELRNGSHIPELPQSRCPELVRLIREMISPDPTMRPTADKILEAPIVNEAGSHCDVFLRDYIKDIFQFDVTEERRRHLERQLSVERGRTPRNVPSAETGRRCLLARTPTPEAVPILFTPEPK